MPRQPEETPASPARQFVLHCYNNAMEGARRSWRVFNSALADTLRIAIQGLMRFDPEDFHALFSLYSGNHWMGDVEFFYRLACESGNLSACRSVEKWRNRQPFVHDAKRLYIGAELVWQGVKVRVTSFDRLGEYLTACKYRSEKYEGTDYRHDVLVKRFKITLEELRTGERAKAKPPPPREIANFLRDHKAMFAEVNKREFLKCQSLREAWQKLVVENPSNGMCAIRRILEAIGFDGSYRMVSGWQTKEQALADLDFDRDIDPLLGKYRQAQSRKQPEKEEEEEAHEQED